MRLSMEEVKSIKTMIYSYVGPNEVKNLCDTIEALQQENEQLRAHVARMREAVAKSNDAFHYFCSDPFVFDKQMFWKLLNEALAEIDKAIGGKEDAE